MDHYTIFNRPRRLRTHAAMRSLVRETQLSLDQMITPLFVKEGLEEVTPVSSMPGVFQYPLHEINKAVKELKTLGLDKVLLFGIPSEKDPQGSCGEQQDGIVCQAIETIKEANPESMVISDICMCEYTSHGHCGIIDEHSPAKHVDNDKTVERYVNQSIVHAKAGADMLAPSGMMDGQVGAMRQALDGEGFEAMPIMAYSIKYCSSLYGPFREAAEGAPQFGDRKSYQMDPANGQEAIKEALEDVEQGADILMVKPAHTYLDVIQATKQAFPHMPLAAYHVSGEYSMVMAAAEKGWIDGDKAMAEILLSIKRAGADIIINYHTKEMARLLG